MADIKEKSDYTKSPKNETMGLDMHLKTPAPESENGELNKPHLSKAVAMVERHNERGEHAPTVCGYKHEM